MVSTTPLAPPLPVQLEGERVRLEPLTSAHAPGLRAAVEDGEIWKIPYAPHVPAPERIEEATSGLLADVDAGRRVAWAVVDAADSRTVGLSTFMNFALADRGLEIGNTYLAASAQRTGINAEMKLLLLRHAFEDLDCLRVEFRVHHLNIASRRAVERLGAQQDGILRAHRILPDGTLRHTVVYSILADEWSGVKASLEHRLGR